MAPPIKLDEYRELVKIAEGVAQWAEDTISKETQEETEEGENMPYITSVERIGLKKGFEQGVLENSREMVLEALEVRFGKVQQEIANAVNSINSEDELKQLFRYAIKCASLDEFKKLLDKE